MNTHRTTTAFQYSDGSRNTTKTNLRSTVDSRCETEHSDIKTERLACQAPVQPSVSDGILLLNFDAGYQERLAAVLRTCRYKVLIPEANGVSLATLNDEYLEQISFVVFDLTRLNHDDVWLPLRRICRWRKCDGKHLLVTCCSRIYRGPDFHLLVEKLGARMVYYAE